MADWPQHLQSVVLGLIFSFLLAKLFSVILSFREDNLRITRAESGTLEPELEQEPKPLLGESKFEKGDEASGDLGDASGDKESLVARGKEKEGRLVGADVSDSDDDWEGVESTELDEAFSAATAFVAATAADRSSQKVSSDLQLQLYGLYKIATEGPCSTPQPSAIKMTARAKWQAWNKLGAMPPEEAMQKYIAIVTELFPSWAAGSSAFAQKKKDEGIINPLSSDARPMGPVFSTFVYEEESGNELKLDAVHAFAREGDLENLLKCFDRCASVDLKDSEGRTPLHWAVDRGHIDATELLVNKNADVNAKDNEGQTPLHYAAVCEREGIAELLVKRGAAKDIKDNDGNLPRDLCNSNWPWIQPTAA